MMMMVQVKYSKVDDLIVCHIETIYLMTKLCCHGFQGSGMDMGR